MTDPDDRELDKYLKGDSRLSRLYKEASREQPPPELDDAILAAAKREVRAKPGLSKLLAPVALAASLILGVNLAWNVHNAAPVPAPETTAAPGAPRALPPAPAPAEAGPAIRKELALAQAQRVQEAKKAEAARESDEPQLLAAQEREAVKAKRARDSMESRANGSTAGAMYSPSAPVSAAPPPAPMMRANEPSAVADAAPPPVLSEGQKIERLLAYVGSLQGVTFIRNGAEHTPAEAMEHMKLKRQKAGDRVKTAEDFIKYCASYSTLTGEAYLVRYADGRTRTAEDVLREELNRIAPQ